MKNVLLTLRQLNKRVLTVFLIMLMLLPVVPNAALAEGTPGVSPSQEGTPVPSEEPTETPAPTPTPEPTNSPRPTKDIGNDYGDLLIKSGDVGDSVLSLQMRLRDLGY